MSLICRRCILDEQTPGLTLDENGECNYCKLHDELAARYPNDYSGLLKLKKIADKIRKDGQKDPFDVVVGVSGGSDSLYMLHVARHLGLRPLAVHYDDSFNSPVVAANLDVITNQMGILLVRHKLSVENANTVFRAFIAAEVPDIGAPYDMAIASVLYQTAVEFGVKYIFEGHNFRTEGVSPLGWLYMDGRYVQDVIDRYTNRHDIPSPSFPNMTLRQMLYWTALKRIKKIRPLYFLNADKRKIREVLTANYDWEDYGGVHHENTFAKYYHTTFCPKLGVDQRAVFLGAQVRSGYVNREDALVELSKPVFMDAPGLERIRDRLGLGWYTKLRMGPITRTYQDFKSYKRAFELLKPLFWVLARLELVPWSFYHKYTSKKEI